MQFLVKKIVDGASGQAEYLIVDLPYRDDFETLERVLVQRLGCRLLEKTDGIWFVVGRFEHGDLQFKLTYHEEAGHFATLEQGADTDLEVLLNQLVTFLASP